MPAMPPTVKRWEIAERCPPGVARSLLHLHPVLLQVLYNRGLTDPVDVAAFLQPPTELRDPFSMMGMRDAVERIRAAIRAGERIVVYGDFDADGVTATALLVQGLTALGADASPYIPHRIDEGYGLHNESLDRVAEMGAALVITVDCGIRSPHEVAYAATLGMDIIVTDHHSIQRDEAGRDILPPALAVINPKQQGDPYPFKDLAGVGIAFKLVQALIRTDKEQNIGGTSAKLNTGDLLDLVALGTVADVAPLLGENRVLVQLGLNSLNGRTRDGRYTGPRRVGLQALFAEANLAPGKVNSHTIGFVIGPRLNAAGRLGSARVGYDLLVSPTMESAWPLAEVLGELNRQRQDMTRQFVEQARAMLAALESESYLSFVAGEDFHPGVVGLVAGRLAEELYRPAVVAEIGPDETRGSCRSIPEFNITSALDDCRDLLIRHGGHAAAAGFTLKNENLSELRRRLEVIAGEKLQGLDLAPTLKIDAELDLADLDYAVCARLSELEPHGEANPQPVFAAHGVQVARDSVRLVGREGQHLKMRVKAPGSSTEWDAIGFGMGALADGLVGKLDLAYSIDVNDYSGRPQLTLRDLRQA